jgi:pyruvate carboxylase subunit B
LKYLANVGENTYHISLDDQDTRIDLNINGEPLQIDLVPINGDHTYSLLINGRSYVATMMDVDESCQVMIDGRVYAVDVAEEELARLRSQVKRKHHAGGEQIKAPMPGRIIDIEVAVGDPVESGQGVAIIEAMKMENELRALTGGVVKEIRTRVGDAVNKNDILVVLEEKS